MPKSFRRKSKGEIALHIFVSFIFFLVAASYVYVFLWAVVAGTKTHTEIVINPFSLPQEWHWEHFLDVFSLLEVNGKNFWDMLFNSVYFSVFAVGLLQLVTMSFAYFCTKYKFPGSELPYIIILVMLTLPLYGTGGATYRIFKALGMVDSYTHILCSLAGFNMNFLNYRACFKNMSVQTNKQIINNMEEKTLLGIMSAIIYSGIPQLAKDNGYAVINAVGQARELLKEVKRQANN